MGDGGGDDDDDDDGDDDDMAIMVMMMLEENDEMVEMKIIPNIEMFLPHSISNRSTQVLGRGMDTHLRKHWIFVFSPSLSLIGLGKRSKNPVFGICLLTFFH